MQRADLLAAGRHPLTYCTNVHPADDLAAAEIVYREQAAPTLRASLGEGRLCLGAWWPADVATELASDDAVLARHGDLCEELGVVPMSLNLFPMGRFHGTRVKEAVYEPDWSDDARLQFTLNAARAVARLLQRFGLDYGVMSTVPLGYRGASRDRVPTAGYAENLFRAATALEGIAQETGVRLVLALEPEPWCLLESIAETVTWLVDEAMATAARRGNEKAAREHLGICIDLCHAAVIGESPIDGLQLCLRSGVCVGKVQLSSALVARGPRGREQLLTYDEPVYLHQVWHRGGRRYLDLSEPALAELVLGEDDLLLSHFHVPLHWQGEGALTSTKHEVTTFLDTVLAGALPAGVPLEVETYTNPRIAEEVSFATQYLLA